MTMANHLREMFGQRRQDIPRDPKVVESTERHRKVLEQNAILVAELAGLELRLTRRLAKGGRL